MIDLSFTQQQHITSLDKGIPNNLKPLTITDIQQQNWDLLNEDLPLPIALIKQSALQRNSHWMQSFLAKTKTHIAPHGKTTMSPQLFKQQLGDGAWGMTIATLQQLKVCHAANINNILMANQLIGKQAIHYVYSLLEQNTDLDFYCLVDSIALVKQLAEIGQHYQRPLKVLIEVGYQHGRTGCRNLASAVQVAEAIQEVSQYVQLVGIEGFEGNIHGKDYIDTQHLIHEYLHFIITTAKTIATHDYFHSEKIMLSAGGTAYYDIVTNVLSDIQLDKPVFLLIRSGCYLLHDSNYYAQHFKQLTKRLGLDEKDNSPVEHALEIWAYVQSLPEKNLAILNFGKRDASYDVAMPTPLLWYSLERRQSPQALDEQYQILKLDDQHAFLSIPENSPIKVGDMVACGISHPCTTFDKWKWLPIVDDNYKVIDAVLTYF